MESRKGNPLPRRTMQSPTRDEVGGKEKRMGCRRARVLKNRGLT